MSTLTHFRIYFTYISQIKDIDIDLVINTIQLIDASRLIFFF